MSCRLYRTAIALGALVAIAVAPSAAAQPLLDVHELERQVGSAVVFIRAFQEARSSTEGSGFVIGSNGWVVTNEHVVGSSTDIEVWIRGPSQFECYRALVVSADPRRDLALLRVDATGLAVAELARPGEVGPGTVVASLGYPEGLFTVHRQMRIVPGVVSHIGFPLPDIPERRWIVSDVKLRRGNSGGPLLDHRGRVVGVNTVRRLDDETSLSIPIEEVLLLIADLGAVRERTLSTWRRRIDDTRAELDRIQRSIEQHPRRTGVVSRRLVLEQIASCERLLVAATQSAMTGRWVAAHTQLDGVSTRVRWLQDAVRPL